MVDRAQSPTLLDNVLHKVGDKWREFKNYSSDMWNRHGATTSGRTRHGDVDRDWETLSKSVGL